MRRVVAALAAAALTGLMLAGAVAAETIPEREPLNGTELLAEIAGNTLTGFNGSLFFSEYHSPDGRVLGHNGGQPAEGACWRVRSDAICYYYPRRPGEGTPAEGTARPVETAEYCWRFGRAGAAGYRIALLGRTSGGIARLETGNPHNHTDRDVSWTCDALVSRRDAPARTAAR